MTLVLPFDPRTLSGYEVRILRAMPALEHQACNRETLNRIVSVLHHTVSPNRFPMRFVQHGLVHRKKTGRKDAYQYWLTDLGALVLQAVEAQGIDPDEQDELMDPTSTKRGPVTFLATMQSFGLTNLRQLAALTVEERRAFEREWSANMYEACALAGEPIKEPASPRARL